MIKILIIIVLFSISISNEKTRTFILKNGDKITGELIDEDYNSYVVKTNFGELKINKSDIKADKIFIKLKNGDNIDTVDFLNQTNQKNDNTNRFYYPDDQLIDIWFDPIGFTLEENSLYFSGLSWAYGITDKFQVSSKWTGYFRGDLNFRPKYMFFKSGDVNKTQAASIGFHYHMRGSPNKRAFLKDDSACEDCPEGEWKYITDMIPNDEPDGSWGEIFIAFTQSNLRETGKGRINYNAGFSITYYKEYDPMQRFYLAIDIDANKKLKLMAEVAYDEYYAPWYNLMNDEDTKPIHFDFGFMYTPPYNENLRIGIHYQAPWLAFYYKF